MKINEFKDLENKITNQDFNKSYRVIDKVMLVSSYLGHIASIFLAYFLLSKIIGGAIPDQPIFVGVVSVILLVILESLKRDFFDKFSFNYLKFKQLFSKDVVPLAIISFIIVSISFYSSINGAKEFSSKSSELEGKKTEQIAQFADSINKIYTVKIAEVESEIKSNKSKIDDKDKEQTSLESGAMTSQQRQRVRDLKIERTAIRDENTNLDLKVKSLKDENKKSIDDYTSNLSQITNDAKNDNSKNSLAFVIISTLIEIIILAGVYFNKYYSFRSYEDFKAKINKDPNYQKWELYDKMLDCIYTNDTKVNDKLPTNKNIVDVCRLNGIVIMPKSIIDFTKTMTSLNIIKSSGSARYFNKTKENSLEALRQHFKIN